MATQVFGAAECGDLTETFWANLRTLAEVTFNGGLLRESPPNPVSSGFGIIVVCPDFWR